MFSSSPLTSTAYEPLVGTYVLMRNGHRYEGTLRGKHNNAYGTVVNAVLEEEKLSVIVQARPPAPANATLYDRANGPAGGFDACTGHVLDGW